MHVIPLLFGRHEPRGGKWPSSNFRGEQVAFNRLPQTTSLPGFLVVFSDVNLFLSFTLCRYGTDPTLDNPTSDNPTSDNLIEFVRGGHPIPGGRSADISEIFISGST